MKRQRKERGVNTAHRTVNTAHITRSEGSSVRPVHGAFKHSMVRHCFNLSSAVSAVYGGASPLTRETCLAMNAAGAHIAETPATGDTP
jgi:hypothetical protein